jgi:hypothetical protein
MPSFEPLLKDWRQAIAKQRLTALRHELSTILEDGMKYKIQAMKLFNENE